MSNYFSSVSAIRDTFNAEGSYWFSRGTMRFFGTTFPNRGKVYGGRFFVSHEGSRLRFGTDAYVVDEVVTDNDGRHTIKTHGYFDTYAEAKESITELLNDAQ